MLVWYYLQLTFPSAGSSFFRIEEEIDIDYTNLVFFEEAANQKKFGTAKK